MERLTIVTILIAGVIVASGQVSPGDIDENSELRTMLKQTMTILQQSMNLNRELQQYMDELRPVWGIIQSMCGGIFAQHCTCKIPDDVNAAEEPSLEVNATEESSEGIYAKEETSEKITSNATEEFSQVVKATLEYSEKVNATEDTLQEVIASEEPSEEENAKKKSPERVYTRKNSTEEVGDNDDNTEDRTEPSMEWTQTVSYVVSEQYPLKILSVKSEGELENNLGLTVYYTALENHATQWIIYYDGFNRRESYRTGGEIKTFGGKVFTTSVLIENVDIVPNAILEVYSGNEMVSAMLDVPALLQMKGNEVLPEYKVELLDMNDTYAAQRGGNLDLQLTVDGSLYNVSVIPYIDVELAWIDTSVHPHWLVFTSYTTYNTFASNGQSTDDITSTTIHIDKKDVRHGGIMRILFPWTPDNLNAIKHIKYGVFLNILSEFNDIYQRNTVAMRWLNKRVTMKVGPKQSLYCLAAGNPPPEVDIYHTLRDGKGRNLSTESIRLNGFTRIVLYQLTPEDRRSPGDYTCRAKSGHAYQEESTKVVVYAPVFDAAETGVTRNTTNRIVVSCKASGSVRPKLRLIMYGKHVGFVDPSVWCKVTGKRSGKRGRMRSSMLKFVALLPGCDVDTVKCVANTHGIEERKVIELFPDIP